MMMGCEFQLPEPIIQHIQSFLTEKEAAQTTVLSKTRPNLEFNENDFENLNDDIPRNRFHRNFGGCNNYDFSEYALKTIKRYEKSNITIKRLRLRKKNGMSQYHVSELILRALKIGVTHLSYDSSYCLFYIPREVFEAENLVELSLVGCTIDIINSIKCPRLESLSLEQVKLKRCGTIYNIISSCPLIQKLSLSCVYETQVYTAAGLLCAPSPTNLPKLCELRCLVLMNVNLDTYWYFSDLFPKLPSLKDLTLTHCRNVRGVCSPSLERLTFVPYIPDHRSRVVEFDVSSIDKFTLEGSVIPCVYFKSTSSSKYWESRVTLTSGGPLTTSWFLELNQLLTELSQSKIYLSLHIRSEYCFDYEVGGFEGLPKPQVENITVDIKHLPSLNCYALFDGLFRLCRPRFITMYLVPRWSYRGAKTNNDFICTTLVQAMIKGECSFQCLWKYGLRDLEEVNAEIYDEVVRAWKPLPLESLLDASMSLREEQKIRFQLKWNL